MFLRFVFTVVAVLVRSFFISIDRLTKKPLVGMMIVVIISAAVAYPDNEDSVNSDIDFGKSLMPFIYLMVILFVDIFVAVTVSALPAGDIQDPQGIDDELGNIIDSADNVTIGTAPAMPVMPSTYDSCQHCMYGPISILVLCSPPYHYT